eukprot:1083566-Pyramimonas_sp.AAC.1
MRHIELKDLWIKDLASRKAETEVSASKVHTDEKTANLGTKHLSRIDFMKRLTAMQGQIGKPALGLVGALTQCLVGLGAFLQMGRADAAE